MSIYLTVKGWKEAKLRQRSWFCVLGLTSSDFGYQGGGFANPAGPRINFLA